MIALHGFEITEQLYASRRSLVYRASRKPDGLPVILKVLPEAYPSPERIAWFRREYELTRTFGFAGVAQAYSLEQDQQRWIMVLEDFGGESLTRLGLKGNLDLAAFLQRCVRS